MKISERMRETLETAARNPLRRVHDETLPGKPPWPAPANTLHALEEREYLERNERRSNKGWKLEEWTITDAGREALKPPAPRTRADTPVYLAPGSGYTNQSFKSIDRDDRMGALPAVHPSELKQEWRDQAAEQLADARNRKHAARRLARLARVA